MQDYQSTDEKILLALFEKGVLSFRGVCNFAKLSPRAVQRHLSARLPARTLVQQGLVHEQGDKNWKRGRKKSFSLTSKGREKLSRDSMEALNSLLERIRKLVDVYLLDPNPLRRHFMTAYKAALIKPMIEPDTNADSNDSEAIEKDMQRLKGYSKKEAFQEMERIEKLLEPINECFKSFYMLYLEIMNTDPYTPLSKHEKVTEDDLKNRLLGFTTGGYPYFKSVNELKEHGIYVPTHSEA